MTPMLRRLLDSTLTALAVALTTHLVTIVLFAAINGATLEVLTQVNGIFGFSSILLFLFLALAGLAPIYRHWAVALGTGILSALLSSWFGALLALVVAGNPITQELIDYLWLSVLGFNTIFAARTRSLFLSRRLRRTHTQLLTIFQKFS